MAALARATRSLAGDLEEPAPSRECAGTLRALRELYEPSASAAPVKGLALLHDLARRSATMEHTLAAEALGRQRLAGELRMVVENAIEQLALPGVYSGDNGHGTLVVHGLRERDEAKDDDQSSSAESSSESEWSDTKHARVGDAFQVDVPPMATESVEREDRLVCREEQIWANEDRKPTNSLRAKRRCSTPGCALPDGHLGPHSEDAACEGTRSWGNSAPRVKKFKLPDNRPTVFAHAVVGRRVSVFWPSEGQWYNGHVYAYNNSNDFHSVLYDDGDDNDECLCDPTTDWALLG